MQASQPPMQQSGAPASQQGMQAPGPGPSMQHMQYQPPSQQQQQQQQQQYQQPQHQAPAAQPSQQQQQQQQYPHQGLNGGWQSDQDYDERRKMIAKIVQLLKQRKPNAPADWLKKLPQMAKRLEESLYRSAKSFGEYNDANTLKQRLQQLAHSIGIKTKRMQQAQMAQRAQQGQPPSQPMHGQPPQQQQQQHQQQQYRPPQQQSQVQQQQPIAPMQQQPVQPRPAQPMHQPPQQQQHSMHMQQQQPQQQQQQQQQPSMQGQRIVNVAEINPMMGAQPQMMQQNPAPAPGQPTQYQYQQQPAPAPPAPAPAAPMPAPAPAPGQNGARPASDRQQVLRHQQQRLLLLRHAAKCQHEDGRCTVTPHCSGMKALWKHIAECKDQKCLVPHCVSSRYVLSHYHRCKDVHCPVCGPVREAIHRSHEKQKQIQAQRAQQQQRGMAPQPAPQPIQPMHSGPPGSSAPIQPPPKRQRTDIPGPAPAPMPQYQPQPPVQQPQHPGQPMVSAPVSQPPVGMPQPPAAPSHPGQPAYAYSQPAVQPAKPVSQPMVQTAPGVAYQNGQMITPKYAGPKPQEDHTLINCFSIEQIETHIASLNKGLQLAPLKLKTKCLEVLKILQSHQHSWVFNSPVDPVELGLPDYFEVIRRPMDLGTIRKRLENNCYHSLEDFEGHVNLTFDNAMLYNPEGSVVYNMAKEMKDKFAQDYAVMMEQLDAEEDQKRRNGEACLLCGCEKLLFEPPVFYCNGLNCPSKRIRRNSYYYVGGGNQYHWCHQCFQELKDGRAIELGDVTIRKEQLTKKKNDEVHEESWVQCDRCERWVHQICALFNTRQNKDQRSEYACPRCTIEDRKSKGLTEGTSSTPMAEDLQRTKLSEYLENHVRVKMDEHLEEAAQKLVAQGMNYDDAKKQIEMGGAITIRQVTSMDKKLEVRERMQKRYAFRNYPDEFQYRCKCIVVFQNLDGVDVILFGLYVYEHDEKVKLPNQRAIYISYLDSVHYMRPRNMRTFIYHEILISYLDYVRKRGFSSAHIWACPPLKGDDYILYAKPEDQKTPKDDRLRQWYIDMLVEGQRRGYVGKITNMYDLYFANKANDATVVPYMDGDYFPAEVENIIKDIEEGKTGKKGGSNEKKKKNDKSKKKKSGRGGTRSTGLDEEALKASGMVTPGKDQKSLEEGGRDYVMVKLGETIQPMKESFIVAFLAWEGAREEDMEVPKEIQEYREKHGIVVKCKPQETKAIENEEKEKEDATEDKEMTPANEEVNLDPPGATVNGVPSPEADASSGDAAANAATDPAATSSTDAPGQEGTPAAAEPNPEAANGDAAPAPAPTDAPAASQSDPQPPTTASDANASDEKPIKVLPMEQRAGKFAAMARKRVRDETDESPKPEEPAKEEEKEDKEESTAIYVTDSKGRRVKVIDDDDEEMDCEFLNNRQAFLNLCQGNHYQFDHLRRAKHSSMMVLWHLHNRDAPKFVQQCTTCSREILSGYRFHCPQCADFDQCQECVQNPNTPRHPHQLKPIPVSGQQAELTEAQRKERQRSIQLHMTLLLHAATCNSPKCPSANCTKMKGLLKHGAQCQQKAAGGCNVCKRIWALLQIHARQCKATSCPVPNCMAIRERVRQLKKQQQAMDDRRRQEMNRVYRGASR